MPKFKIDLSDDIDSRLNEISQSLNISKAETMKKAFALLFVAIDEQEKGNSIGIVKEESEKLIALHKIIGL